MNDKPKHSKQIIEIADYIFANPEKNRSAIIEYFGAKWSKSNSTIDKYIIKATEYNRERLQGDEKVKEEARHAEIREAAKRDVLTRYETLEILSNIIDGDARKVGAKISTGDIITAIAQLAKMEGWYAPTKSANTDAQGEDIPRPRMIIINGEVTYEITDDCLQ
ncbi:MAG: hypothetical protein FWE10_08340 [Rikenellaceae bacterium]|nr:hypothetical protein [Rikenellaceae bacterium]